MNNIEIAVATKAESMYLVHLLNTDVEHEFNFRFDLSEKEELNRILNGISHGDAGAGFEAHLNMTFEDVDLITNLNVTKYITY